MEIPINISTRDVDLPPGMEDLIRRRVGKLERFFNDLVGCRVMVEAPGQRHQSGGPYQVRVEMSVPNKDLVVSNQPAEDLRSAVDDAFDAAERQIKEYAERARGETKQHIPNPVGPVVRLFPEEGYGFIASPDGRQIYFHENAVLDPGFQALELNMRVRFAEEQGHEGPQASTVEIISAGDQDRALMGAQKEKG